MAKKTRIAGITIELNGDSSKLVDSLKKVDKQLSATQDNLRDINKLLKLDPGNTELLTQKQKNLESAIKTTKERLDMLKDAQIQYGKGTSEYDAIQREIIETEQNLKSLEKEHKEFGSVAKQKLKIAAEGIKEAAQKTLEFGKKAKEAFANASAQIGGFANAAIKAGQALYKVAVDAAETADRVDKMSQKIGISREAYQELDYAMGQAGMSVDTMQAGMKTMTSKMSAATSGNKSAANAFKKLGVSVKDSSGMLRSQEEVMFDSLNALQRMENQTEKAKLATELFGKSGTELMPLLNGASGSIDEMRQRAHELGLVMSDEAVDAGVLLGDTIDDVKKTFKAITTQIGVAVMPMIQTVMDWILNNMPMIQETIRGVIDVVSKVIGGIVAFITENVLPALRGFIENNIKPGIEWFEKAFERLGRFFESLADGGVNTIFYLEGFIYDAIAGILSTLGVSQENVEGIMEKVWEAIKSVSDVIEQYVVPAFEGLVGFVTSAFAGDWESAWESIRGVFDTVWSGIAEFFSGLFNDAVALIKEIDWKKLGEDIWGWICKAFEGIKKWGEETFNLAVDGIKSINWKEVGQQVWDWIVAAFSNIANDYTEIYNKAAEAIKAIEWKKVGEWIWDAIKEAFNTIVQWFKDLFSLDKQGGVAYEVKNSIDWKKLGESILNLIESAFSAIWDVFKGIFENAFKSIESIEWSDVGVWILDKIKAGFEIFGPIASWFEGKFDTAKEWIKSIRWGEIATDIWNKITTGLAGIGEWLVGVFKTPINTIIDGINWMIDKVESAVNTVIRGINNTLKIEIPAVDTPFGKFQGWKWGANLNEVKWGRIDKLLANGGTLAEGQRAIVGEYAPEYLTVRNGQAVVTPIQGAQRWGQGDTINNTFQIYQQPGENANALAERVMRIMTRQQEQRNNAYA